VGILSLAALSSIAVAQIGGISDGYKFLKAVRERDATIVTNMVEEPGASSLINTRDQSSGETALHIVAQRRDTAWIRFLSENGANPNIADKDGVTPLMISSRLGHIDGVIAFLEAGARIDPITSTGETPLIFAVHKRDVPLVRVLLANGANPDRTDNSGRSARDYVALIGERRMSEEFKTADEQREDDTTKQYGPSL
tara:strand:+ start:901 stop:1491 length:591 start_codon:yes stop_codon:yes gene_type:complete